MSGRIENKKYTFNLPYKNSQVHIKLLSDLQFCASFQREKLTQIDDELTREQFDYLCIPGDVLDSTNFLQIDSKKREELLRWIERTGKRQKLFISLGNHDISRLTEKGWSYEFDEGFWKEVASLEGVHLSHYEPYFEDDKIIVCMLEPEYGYYYNKKEESKDLLISQLKNYRDMLTNLEQTKTKIMMVHSPIYMSDPDVLKLINEYDLVLSGHMHNGVVPPIIDKIFKGNIGIIAPNKDLFPDNARGVKVMNIDGKEIYLVISGGIIKLAECAGFLSNFNDLVYPMSIDDIQIQPKTLNLK